MKTARSAPKNKNAERLYQVTKKLMRVERFFDYFVIIKAFQILSAVSVFLVVFKLFGAPTPSWFFTTLFIWLPFALNMLVILAVDAAMKLYPKINR